MRPIENMKRDAEHSRDYGIGPEPGLARDVLDLIAKGEKQDNLIVLMRLSYSDLEATVEKLAAACRGVLKYTDEYLVERFDYYGMSKTVVVGEMRAALADYEAAKAGPRATVTPE